MYHTQFLEETKVVGFGLQTCGSAQRTSMLRTFWSTW